MNRRFSLLMVLVLVAATLLPATVNAQVIVTDGPQPARPAYSHRLIVELTSPPLVQASSVAAAGVGPTGKLDVTSPTAQAYIQTLQAEQAQFVTAMQQAIPNARVSTYINERGATVPATYQILLNGMAVETDRSADVDAFARQLSRLPNVRRVSKDFAHSPDLYASIPLINAPAAWAAVGGQDNAGKGIKFASVDGGVHKDAPMFNGTGYTYPPGFPKGDTNATNGKIIVARKYFRTWDPPSPGDENAWPGVLGTSHGNHTASIAAGEKVQASYLGAPPVTISGVAPKAWVMSYRVFYNSITNDASFYNAEGIKALEDAVADGADVINNSWGNPPYTLGGEFDALDAALQNAVVAGVFVSMSAGNAGPGLATSDHPSTDYITVAASTTSGTYAAGRLNVTAPEPVPADLKSFSYGIAEFGAPLPRASTVGPFSFVPSDVVAPANVEGCTDFPAGAFTGKAALIRRGTCNFSLKVLNAQKAGATFAIIYNQASAGDTTIDMGPGTGAEQVTISSVLVGNTNGVKLVNWYTAHPADAQVNVDTTAYQVGNKPDVIANFSSRGPAVGNGLKPDITAPGVNILAQGFAPGETGEARHLGFGQASGTSMAAPHVAGAGIMLKQIHPTWSPAWIKSALMSTSKYQGIFTQDGKPAEPLDMGAGRLDLTHAADPGVILDPPSLTYGAVTTGGTKTMTVTLTSVSNAAESYTVTTLDTRAGFTATTTLAGVTVTPTTINLPAHGSAKLAVKWDTSGTSGPGDQQGFVVLKSASHEAHFPLWVRVAYAPNPSLGQVLVIDNDASTSPGGKDFPDFTHYYTETLKALGVTYDVWDENAHAGESMSLPDANYLAQYKAVIYQTGNNFRPNPPSQPDMDVLTEYANNGGPILAFGQDLAGVTQGNATTPSTLYAFTLGAKFLQDSINGEKVFTQTAQLLTGVQGGPYGKMNFDISARGDGAGNQAYIDEIGPGCFDPDSPTTACPVSTPLLQYGIRGNDKGKGYVALATTERTTLERPGVISKNKTMIFGFGLEGVNNNTGFNTRQDLLGTALHWAWDQPTVKIDVKPDAPGRVTQFTATMTSEFGGKGVTYRWDFGDGTAFTNPYTSATVGHTYAKPGRYTVRVEATNELGTTVIGTTTVQVGTILYLPVIAR